jgi:hypothetical protein
MGGGRVDGNNYQFGGAVTEFANLIIILGGGGLVVAVIQLFNITDTNLQAENFLSCLSLSLHRYLHHASKCVI